MASGKCSAIDSGVNPDSSNASSSWSSRRRSGAKALGELGSDRLLFSLDPLPEPLKAGLDEAHRGTGYTGQSSWVARMWILS